MSNPVCVALDLQDGDRARSLATALSGRVGALKIGLTTFAANGPDIVRDIRKHADVFLDLKLHDIPAQVEGAVGAIADLDVTYTTVHASGGQDMVAAAVKAAPDSLTIVAVTMLTSLDDAALARIGYSRGASDTVSRLAALALDAGAGGLVCSPLEVEDLRKRFGTRLEGGPILIVPGIRPTGSTLDDQRRVATPREAVEAGADLIVVGRPITGVEDPGAALDSLLQEIA
jgi:orotidine-5'-phosphate decarboxylase